MLSSLIYPHTRRSGRWNWRKSRCKSGANKFVCNRYKLLELLHGNKLVRTESDNTAAAALRPRMVCSHSNSDSCWADMWMATVFFLFPIHVSRGKEHRRMPPSMTTTRNYEGFDFRGEASRAEQNINPSIVEIAIITASSIDIFQLKREFHGEINEDNEWDGDGNGNGPKEDLLWVSVGDYQLLVDSPKALKVIHHIIIPVVPSRLIPITTLGLMTQIINTRKLKF